MTLTGRVVVGIDIGNSTTEAIVLEKFDTDSRYLSGSMTATTGVKGTPDNVRGCITALDEALRAAGLSYADVAQIRLNQAAPVSAICLWILSVRRRSSVPL